jgi:hypothetical protein
MFIISGLYIYIYIYITIQNTRTQLEEEIKHLCTRLFNPQLGGPVTSDDFVKMIYYQGSEFKAFPLQHYTYVI